LGYALPCFGNGADPLRFITLDSDECHHTGMNQLPTRSEDLTKEVSGLAMKIHRALGPGFVEFVYRNAMIVELRRSSIPFEIERPMKVAYDGVTVGEFSVDLFVWGWLVIELKAVSTLTKEHEVQVVNYLTALKQPFGLLINFGAPSLQYKRKYQRPQSSDSPDLKA
jgi:GxxExxY protein